MQEVFITSVPTEKCLTCWKKELREHLTGRRAGSPHRRQKLQGDKKKGSFAERRGCHTDWWHWAKWYHLPEPESSAHSDHGDLSSAHPKSGNPHSFSLSHSASGLCPDLYSSSLRMFWKRSALQCDLSPSPRPGCGDKNRTNSKDRYFHKQQKNIFWTFFYWSIVDLQYCVSFKYTAQCSVMYTLFQILFPYTLLQNVLCVIQIFYI